MVALGEMESDWNVSQTTWSPFWRRREQINFFLWVYPLESAIILHTLFLKFKNCSIANYNVVIDQGIFCLHLRRNETDF